MTPERWAQIEEIFQAAREEPEARRLPFIIEQCKGDASLQVEVESLLAAETGAGAFLRKPAVEFGARMLEEESYLVAGKTVGHYRLIAPIGAGGMGEVWRAADDRVGRDVALKFCNRGFDERFKRESRAIACLNHPNICQLYDVGPNYLVMELVEGKSLNGPRPLPDVLRCARQLIDALDAAHQNGIVHRDLKPGNIMIRSDGVIKVLDFGLAKFDRPSGSGLPAGRDETRKGCILGTASYMSPEQIRGENVDKRADIWAFGAVLYELLTGQSPFARNTYSDTVAAVLTVQPDWARVPAQVGPLLRKCLEQDPRNRLRDIADAWELLEMHQPRPRRVIWPWLGMGLVMLVAVLAFLVSRSQPLPGSGRPVRFSIAAPEGTDFGGAAMGLGMAISPDGRKLAFITSDRDGRTQIWLRSLDSFAMEPLSGTEGAIDVPAWSPDSRSLAFIVSLGIKKIEGVGDAHVLPAQPVAELRFTPLGLSWGSRGTILFSRATAGVFSVPENGGTPVEISPPDAGKGELGRMRPWFLPDGRHFLYVSRTPNNLDSAIWLADTEDHSVKRLVNARQAAVYVPPASGARFGHVLYLRGTNLMALPMDAQKLAPAGDPFVVEGPVGSVLASGFFAVSANGILAYRSDSNGKSRLVWFDRDGKSLGMLGDPASYFGNMSLSSDGKRLASSQLDDSGNSDIFTFDLARSVKMRLTFDPTLEAHPIWSLDNRWIFFGTEPGETGAHAISRKLSDGSTATESLLKTSFGIYPEHISPDGKYLMCQGVNAKTGFDLPILENPGGTLTERHLIPYLNSAFNERQGQFSPDGHWVAYASDEATPGTYQIYVRTFPEGAHKVQISIDGGTQPRWRRDGKELFYVRTNGNLVSVAVMLSPGFQAGNQKTLFNTRLRPGYFHYDVVADGRRFLVAGPAPESSPPTIHLVLNWPRQSEPH